MAGTDFCWIRFKLSTRNANNSVWIEYIMNNRLLTAKYGKQFFIKEMLIQLAYLGTVVVDVLYFQITFAVVIY